MAELTNALRAVLTILSDGRGGATGSAYQADWFGGRVVAKTLKRLGTIEPHQAVEARPAMILRPTSIAGVVIAATGRPVISVNSGEKPTCPS